MWIPCNQSPHMDMQLQVLAQLDEEDHILWLWAIKAACCTLQTLEEEDYTATEVD